MKAQEKWVFGLKVAGGRGYGGLIWGLYLLGTHTVLHGARWATYLALTYFPFLGSSYLPGAHLPCLDGTQSIYLPLIPLAHMALFCRKFRGLIYFSYLELSKLYLAHTLLTQRSPYLPSPHHSICLAPKYLNYLVVTFLTLAFIQIFYLLNTLWCYWPGTYLSCLLYLAFMYLTWRSLTNHVPYDTYLALFCEMRINL